MNRISLVDIFTVPDSYTVPADLDLASSTEHPNLNSKEYRKKSPDINVKIQKHYEGLIINPDGKPVFYCNDITGRVWNGSMWGYEHIDDVTIEGKSVFRLQCASPITQVKYIEENSVIKIPV